MAVISDSPIPQPSHDQGSLPVLALPPGLQLLADQVAAVPKLQSLRPRLAPRPALNVTPGPRSAPSSMRAPRVSMPVPVDLSTFVGASALGLTSNPSSFASLIGGPAAVTQQAPRRPARRLGSVLRDLKGLPPAALDVTDAWLSAASATSCEDSLGAERKTSKSSDILDASVAKPSHNVDDSEVMKALKAAAATNKGDFVTSDSQFKSWLASRNNDSCDIDGVSSNPALVQTSGSVPKDDERPEISDSLDQTDSSVPPLSQYANEEASFPKVRQEETAANVSEAVVALTLATGSAAAAVGSTSSVDTSCQPQPPIVAAPLQELTGLDMLRAMAETQKVERDENDGFDAKRAASGYAMVSMMHRAAENAKANMRSRKAAELLQSESKPTDETLPEDAKTLPTEAGFLYLGRIPTGTSEGLIMAACTKFGAVSSLFYDAKSVDILEGAWALVKFVKHESATVAISRMSKRSGLFGVAESVEVRAATAEDVARAEKMRESAKMSSEQGIGEGLDITPPMLDSSDQVAHAHETKHREQDRKDSSPRRKDKKRKRADRRHDRKRKREDRKRKRRRRSSHSTSSESDDTGSDGGAAKTKVTPVVPVVKEDRKVRGLGGFGEGPSVDTSKAFSPAPNAAVGRMDEPSGGRQVGVRGSWAEFATPDNQIYYVNIITGAKQWPKPIDFDNSTKTGAAITRAKPASGLSHSNIFVGSLPHGLNEIIFRQLFERFGRIVTLKVVPEQRYGFIKYGQVAEAQKAIDAMNATVLGGSPLIVKFANMDRNW